MKNSNSKETKTFAKKGIVGLMWLVSAWFFLIALIGFSTGGTGYVGGLIGLIIAVLINPLFTKFLQSKGIVIKKIVTIPVVVVSFFVSIFLIPTTSSGDEGNNIVAEVDVADDEAVSSGTHDVLGMGEEVTNSDSVDRGMPAVSDDNQNVDKEDKKNEVAKVTEEAKRVEEAKVTEEAKKVEEAKATEEAKKAEEAKAAKEAKKAEEAKAAEEAKKAEEAKAVEEVKDTNNGGNGGDSVIVPSGNIEGEDMVWVPTNGGTKYHSKSTCSNMIDPVQIPKSEAKARNYEPCGRCKPGN